MGCRQCLFHSVVQLKGKHCRKPNCRIGVVDTLEHCHKSLKFVIYCTAYRKAFRLIWAARKQRRLQNSFGLILILKSRKTFLLSKVRVCVNPSAFIEHLCKFPFIWSSTSQLTEYWHLFSIKPTLLYGRKQTLTIYEPTHKDLGVMNYIIIMITQCLNGRR